MSTIVCFDPWIQNLWTTDLVAVVKFIGLIKINKLPFLPLSPIMNTESIYSLLETSFEYAFYSSISKHDKSFRKTSVVSLKNLNNHLQLTVPIDYTCMQNYYHTLLDFLNGQTENCTKWLYEIMTTNKYNQDSCRLNNQF